MKKRGDQLRVGDKVSVWFMPEGATLLEKRPYTGKFQDLFHSVGRFQSRTPLGWLDMTLGSEYHEVVQVAGFPLTVAEVRAIVDDPDLMDEETYEKLYRYYTGNGEMPYGVAKARTGDPDQWILNQLELEFGPSALN